MLLRKIDALGGELRSNALNLVYGHPGIDASNMGFRPCIRTARLDLRVDELRRKNHVHCNGAKGDAGRY